MPYSRTIAVDLARLLDDSVAPIYLLDDQRRIVFCNAACARWTRTKPQDLVGQQCIYHTPAENSDSSGVAAGLCPPPKVFSGQPQVALVRCLAKDGRAVYRRGHFLPLGDGQDESAEVIAILEAQDCSADDPSMASETDAQLHDQVRRFRMERAGSFRPDSLIGTSPAIVRARAQIELARSVGASVLILGPGGSGKDHVAKAIHYGRSDLGDLVPLACAVLEANLLRSTLRALALKSEVTAKETLGTLLLSDVDCMPEEAQADLFDLLRAGSLKMRVVATAARPLAAPASEGKFSRELACALSTITIELPPLAERVEDLPLLAQAFLEQVNAGATKQVGGFSPEALDRLAAYAWPDNVDELADIVRQSHERAQGGEVAARDLPNQIHWAADAASHPPRHDETIVLEEFLARVEKELITRAMRRAKGNKSKAAKLLGLTRPRLYRRLVQLGMEQPADGGE
ncbi:MAG TPA: helix-turn-helix domain-containing protein [Pirellulales bacterium]|jgi:DNA-binding NtrC family response regulator|nr:helix-turn-helix domain-containing protein [Pirellulales bacterium]